MCVPAQRSCVLHRGRLSCEGMFFTPEGGLGLGSALRGPGICQAPSPSTRIQSIGSLGQRALENNLLLICGSQGMKAWIRIGVPI